LFGMPGVKGFVIAGFIGRLPMAMLGIGTVLLVSAVTGSYATAGGVSAMGSLMFAAAAPVTGRLTDRFGQSRVLVPLALLHGVALSSLLLSAHLRAPDAALYLAGMATGATAPALGPMVRARWSHVLKDKDPGKLHTAFSFESVVDETIFISGPALVSALAATVNVYAGLIAAIAFTLAGALTLASFRGTEPPVVRETGKRHGTPIAIPGVALLTVVFLGVGSVFGSIDLITVGFAEEQGHRGAAGFMLALIASGSAISGLWYGSRAWRIPLHTRFVRTLTLFALGLIPVTLMEQVRPMLVALFVAGLSISPTLITGFSLVQRLVPAGQLTEGMAWLSTAIGFGVALGSWAGGWLTDAYGAHNAYAFSFGCALLAAVVGMAGSALVRVDETGELPHGQSGRS